MITHRTLAVTSITVADTGHVAIQVSPPDNLDLQFIYRAARCVYWEPAASQLQDRTEGSPSSADSARRIREALEGEYGRSLNPAPKITWRGADASTQEAVREALGWSESLPSS